MYRQYISLSKYESYKLNTDNGYLIDYNLCYSNIIFE